MIESGSLPLIAAPMLLVSGIDYVVAARTAGIGGAFPTANCRSADELDRWLQCMETRCHEHADRTGCAPGPLWPNLIVHRSNPRRDDDLGVLVRHRVGQVITSVGAPDAVLGPLHDIGCKVYADVASLHHAQRAARAGVDGLILLTAGAGGQTGWANPFAFARAVRAFWSGPMVLAGGVHDGAGLFAARVLGFDLAYMGTRMIATDESMAAPAYKRMLERSTLDDIVLTRAFTGLETNMLRPSIEAAGLDPNALPAHDGLDAGRDLDGAARERRAGGPDGGDRPSGDPPTGGRRTDDSQSPRRDGPRRWRDVWSAGHAVSGVDATLPMHALVERVRTEYAQAARQAAQLAGA